MLAQADPELAVFQPRPPEGGCLAYRQALLQLFCKPFAKVTGFPYS